MQMNNDMMMPLFGFLLQSEDLKKQTDRVIQEVKQNNDAKKLAEEYINNINNADVIQKLLLYHEETLKSLQSLRASVESLKRKIGKHTGTK